MAIHPVLRKEDSIAKARHQTRAWVRELPYSIINIESAFLILLY